jgi:hypothetical protein
MSFFINLPDALVHEIFTELLYADDICKLSTAFCNIETRPGFLTTLQTNMLTFHCKNEDFTYPNMVSWINANYIFFPDCMILKFSQHRNLVQTLRDVIQTFDTTRMSKLVLESDKHSQTEISVEGLEFIFFEFHVRSISWYYMLNSTASVTECCDNGLFGNLTQLFVIECPNMDSLDILRMMIQSSPNLVNIKWDGVSYISFELVDTLIHCLTGLESLVLIGTNLVKGLEYLYYGNMSLKKTIELTFNSHLNAIDVENTCEFFKNVGNFDEVTLFTCDQDNNTQYDEDVSGR